MSERNLKHVNLKIKHIELRDTNQYIANFHRHHKPVTGHRFSIACYEAERLCGVAIVGRHVARRIDQHQTVEVLRLCTDGTPNTCSALYGACRRCARELGYCRIITYVLQDEPGTSLKAAGWQFVHVCGGGSWNCKSRPRKTQSPTCKKKLFEYQLK